MRFLAALMLVLALVLPGVQAQAKDQQATMPMAQGFEDYLTVVSGRVDLDAPRMLASTGFFRTTGVDITGLNDICWRPVGAVDLECAGSPVQLVVTPGSSFGFKPAADYPAQVKAAHGLVTFVDLSKADGFDDRLQVGSSAIMSLVQSSIRLGPAPTSDIQARAGFTLLESGGQIEIRSALTNVLLHTANFNDDPLQAQGTPRFASQFSADVVVLPFENGAVANFVRADPAAARIGLSDSRLSLLEEVLRNVRFLGPDAKSAPLAILARAGAIMSEVFNGAFIRARLADDPRALGDVGFAKFDQLTVTGKDGAGMTFDGSYTLVVGDLGPAFADSGLNNGGLPLRWWMVALFVVAVVALAAWLWVRGPSLPEAKPGPPAVLARIATAVGVIALFLVWDWQLSEVLGSSLLTTRATGASLGILMAVELATLTMAALLIGVPSYVAVRFGLGLLRKPELQSLSATCAVFLTLGLGLLVFPALVAFLLNLAA